jgi:GNAT superfamily N-acetyltransferase
MSALDPKYEVIRYRTELRQQVLDLQRHHWNRDIQVNSAYLNWKYEINPYITDPRLYLILYNGELVGMRGFYGAEWEVGARGSRIIAPCAGDLVIVPEHRGKGLFPKLMEFALNDLKNDGYSFVFNFSAMPPTWIQSVRGGWRFAGPHRYLTREGTSAELTATKPAVPKNILIETEPRLKQMSDLVSHLRWDGRIRHVRNERYFSWRFRNPRSEYKFLYWIGDTLEGYAVIQGPRITPARLTALLEADPDFSLARCTHSILDWESSSSEVRDQLLAATISQFGGSNLEIAAAMFSVEGVKTFESAGFYPNDSPKRGGYIPGLLVKDLQRAGFEDAAVGWDRSPMRLENWDFRTIYGDAE